MHSYSSQRHGFTIIELLVVIVIIGLLTAAAATSYVTAQRNARDNLRKTQINALANAVESYYAVNKQFPGKQPTDTPDSSLENANCEFNINGYFAYFSFPLGTAYPAPRQTGGNNDETCDQVTPSTPYPGGVNPYKPYPAWIPGLGSFINPFPIDTHYQGNTGGQNDGYQEVLWASDGNSTNKTRTYVYAHLKGGYALYTRLEGVDASGSTLDGTSHAIDYSNKTPSLPTQITGSPIYLILK